MFQSVYLRKPHYLPFCQIPWREVLYVAAVPHCCIPLLCVGGGGNSLRRSLECISLSYTCSHQDNKKFRVALDTKHKMQVSSVLTEDHFMLSHDALGILNCYPQSPRDSQLKKKAHSHSPISKDQGQLPQCLVTRTGHCKPSS